MRRQEFGDLFVFMALAETLSFTQAAVFLRTSQPVVSQAISRLEHRFGKLFERGPKGVTGMTDAGQRLAGDLFPALMQIQSAVLNAEKNNIARPA